MDRQRARFFNAPSAPRPNLIYEGDLITTITFYTGCILKKIEIVYKVFFRKMIKQFLIAISVTN